MYVYVNAGTSTKTSTNRSTIGRTLVGFGYKFERRVLNTSTKFEYEYEYEMIGGISSNMQRGIICNIVMTRAKYALIRN